MNRTRGRLNLGVFALILFVDVIESLAEVCFKYAAMSTGIRNVTSSTLGPFASRILSTPTLWVGVALFLIIFFLWIIVLSKVDLSVAFPLGCGLYVFVPLLAVAVLHETVSVLRASGTLFVVVGVFFVSRSTRDHPDRPA